eukprot:773595-Pyramimonas_sp.AAC.1
MMGNQARVAVACVMVRMVSGLRNAPSKNETEGNASGYNQGVVDVSISTKLSLVCTEDSAISEACSLLPTKLQGQSA